MSESAEAEPDGTFPPSPSGRVLRTAAAPPQGFRRLAGAAARFTLPQLSPLRTALMLEAERGALFLCVPVLLGCGAVLYFKAPFEPSLPALLVALLCSVCATAMLRARRIAFLALSAVTLCLAGVTAGSVETWRHSTKVLGSEVTTRLTGRVARVDRLTAGRVRLTIDLVGTERPTLRFAPARVRVTAAKLTEPVRAGSVVEGLVRLMPPSGPAMPGGYDFSFQSYFDGIGASGFFLGKPSVRPAPEAEPRLSGWVENVRDTIAQRVRSRIGGAEGEIAAALIVGVRGGIPEEVNEALRRTGLAHVLSISGLHMALVAATVMGGGRALLACLPGFASRRPVKKLVAGAALVLITAYLAFSGADVAAVRSFLMLAVMLIAVLFDRAALSVRNLAIAATIILLAWPHEILGPSFQMSFAATGALVAAFAAWADHRAKRQAPAAPRRSLASHVVRRGGETVLALAATSVIAGAATAAFGIYHFQRVSPLSLPSNLVVMPIVSVLVMPFALLAVLAMPLGLDGPFLAVMGLGLHWMIGLTRWFSDRSPLDAVGAIPVQSLILAVLALLAFTVATTRLRFLALPLAALACLAAFHERPVKLFISEDAKLVGISLSSGQLAVNTARGGGFTLENWMHASAAGAVLRPIIADAAGSGKRGESGKPERRSDQGETGAPRFLCEAETCRLTLPSGAIVAYAQTQQAAIGSCAEATVLVVAEAAKSEPCAEAGNKPALVLTKRDLARRGSAALVLPAETGPADAALRLTSQTMRAAGLDKEPTFALASTPRPWHDHRRFSRAARGLPEHEPFRKRRSSLETDGTPKR